MIMASRRPESLMYLLHDEIVLFIMNKCWWEWCAAPRHPGCNPTSPGLQPLCTQAATPCDPGCNPM